VDIVWSEDAFLHSGNKGKVFEQAQRVLKPGGHFIFTDPMQSDDCSVDVLQPILDRIHLKELGSVKEYRALAAAHGFKEKEIIEMPEQLTNHYKAVLDELRLKELRLRKVVSAGYIEHMKKGLQHWIEGGEKGYLNWGILHFEA
jgi:sarcosine/dimethylglycine N-methyltransferase